MKAARIHEYRQPPALEEIRVPARYLVKVDQRLKPDERATLTDAEMKPYRGIKKLHHAYALGSNRFLRVPGRTVIKLAASGRLAV